MDWKQSSIVLGLVISLAAVVKIGYSLDQRYNQSEKVITLEQSLLHLNTRFDINIVEARLDGVRKRIWALEDRYPNRNTMPQSTKEEYRQLQEEKKVLEDKLQLLYKK